MCENCIVYCADRIRCFPGKRRSQEVQHFTGKHAADSVQTLVTPTARLREVKTFGLILYLVQSIKQALLPLTPQQQVGILNRNKNQPLETKSCQYGHGGKLFLQLITNCKNRRQHTMIIEPIRGDYIHLTISQSIFPRLNSPDRLQGQIKGWSEGTDDARERWTWELTEEFVQPGGGGFRPKAGLGSEVGNLDVFRGK